MATKHGKDAKVTLGAADVVGMGTWNLSGITTDQADTTVFNQNWKSFKFGAKDGGTVSFNGLLDPADTTGQDVLRAAQLNNTNITNLRLYVDDTSYYEPCQTTGYFTPSDTSGNDTILSYLNVTSFDVGADKGGMITASFQCKVSGVMVLV